jgi:vacuolar-type H+-ATPase subunit D/Vma8
MQPIDFAAILVAAIAAFGAWAAQRAAAKANLLNSSVSGRLEAERDAYERARAFDIHTIARQDAELENVRRENEQLREELRTVKHRLAHLENDKIPYLERQLHAQNEELDDS